MTQGTQFRRILLVSQAVLAAFFGGLGLWQRNEILNRYAFLGWNSRARFHVWPWSFKFAVVSNLPAFLAGLLLSWPIGLLWPELPEAVQLAPSLLFVLVLWYWVGSWVDRCWGPMEKAPWILLAVFTAVCLIGAFIPMGYIGYLPYAVLLWLAAASALRNMTKRSPNRRS
jgi:hypothetical protein